MKKIEAYPNIETAMRTLDNGGRFYNLLAKANNKVITQAELGKVAGLFNDKQKMMLYLELAIRNLSPGMKSILLSKLTPELLQNYEKYRPQYLLPSAAEQNGVLGNNVILKGIPKLTDAKTELSGFVMVPIMAGKTMTMVMIPIMDKYEVYELRDEHNGEQFFIAHAKGEQKLPEQHLTIAGLIKELKPNKKGDQPSKKFLEAIYYLEG
ncbi:MAG: hypothetical protein KKE39_08510 [Bacteroidetes bacterium]|nr:hypothetical protein [Bacteroidota bacterium]MBU1373687.1 hypothetical protein [Bacteroidota bacterium]MBU1485171.1 hypothetical protein [Bacteroidota bacterium]MBU1762181.1 hypothetical protein [Bacteroidota bacterium]MBU2045529.1 hypothetical protein [Bacteroidota bacterium]